MSFPFMKIAIKSAVILALMVFLTATSVLGENQYLMVVHSALADTSGGQGLNELMSVVETNSNVDVVVETIGDGISADSIRNIISAHYWSAPSAPLYVLLVGCARRDTVSPPVDEHISDAAALNFIPGYYWEDNDGHHTLYDNRYAAIDTAGLGRMTTFQYPNVILGRLPAVSVDDIHIYATKLESYHNQRATAAPWKDDILFVAGDRDRGEHNPSPGSIRNETNGLENNAVTPEVETSQILWSDFADIPPRQQALADSVNAGKLLVVGMASGANFLNFCDFWYRGYGDGFDARDDLANYHKYPVFLGASCNLGQCDHQFDSTRSVAENLLFADTTGGIALIGPAGFSRQLANYYFSQQFLSVLLSHPDWSIGKAFAVAKIRALQNPAEAHSLDTHEMYALLGDPSLLIYSDSLAGSDLSLPLTTGFEAESYVSTSQNSVVFKADQITSDTARIAYATGTERVLDNRYYRVAGYDGSATGVSARSMWHVIPVGRVIDDSLRFLTYWSQVPSHPSGKAMVTMNGLLSTSGYLSDSVGAACVTDQYGVGMAAGSRVDTMLDNTSRFYSFDLTLHYGDTLDYLVVEYDAEQPEDLGWYEARFDEVMLSSEWGDAPVVDAINMPSSLNKSTTATASIPATDIRDQAIRGDTLTYTWTAQYGYFTGSGPSVTYHAPSSAVSGVLITCTVSDLGGHVVVRQKSINITAPTQPACPTLYVKTDLGYELDNVVLTASLDDRRIKQTITDYYPLTLKPDAKDNVVRVKLVEQQDELTYIDQIELLAVPVELSRGEGLAIRGDGQLVATSRVIAPLWVDSPLGYDLTSALIDQDGQYFEYYGPGELTLTFADLGAIETEDPGARPQADYTSATAETGGLILDPDPKDQPFRRIEVGGGGFPQEKLANFFTVKTCNGGCTEMGKVYPRLRKSLPVMVDLSEQVVDDRLTVRVQWENHFRADQVAYHLYRKLDQIQYSHLANASHSRDGDKLKAVSAEDNTYLTLATGEEIEFSFEFPETIRENTQFILKVTGYYVLDGSASSLEKSDVVTSLQNYPNPFNPATTIEFALATQAEVQIDVYNVLGQRVISLVDQTLPAGDHHVVWDGNDGGGNQVSSGVYFYRLTTGDFVASRKMLLLR